jgi:DNA-binding NarL/FixJ family response regulator
VVVVVVARRVYHERRHRRRFVESCGLWRVANGRLSGSGGIVNIRLGGLALTRREGDVLVGISEGWSNKQIAHELRLSVRTVEAYAARVQRKLGLQRREIVGLVLPDDMRGGVDIKRPVWS